MKIAVFNYREDEKESFDKWQAEHKDVELKIYSENLSSENVELLNGVSGVVLFQLNDPLTKDVYDYAKEQGIKVFSTRSAGFDVYNLPLMKEYNIKMTNVPSYSPNAISEHVVATTLYLTRHYKEIEKRLNKNNFSWDKNILSREIRTMTVGIVGTGRIGSQTARLFKGLGAKVLGYDVYPNPQNEELLTYVDKLEDLLAQSDVVSIHVPAIEKYHHMVNDEFISNMKDGSILANAARGVLVDTKAILRGLDSGKLSGATLDVYEHEVNFVAKDLGDTVLEDEVMKELISRDNVVYTPHSSFYTTTALDNLVCGALDSAFNVITTGDDANVVNK